MLRREIWSRAKGLGLIIDNLMIFKQNFESLVKDLSELNYQASQELLDNLEIIQEEWNWQST